jgi:hypothetical protein
METVCGRIIAKMLNGKLAAAFVTWCDYATEQRHMQDVCSRVLLKMVHRGLSVAIQTTFLEEPAFIFSITNSPIKREKGSQFHLICL